MPPQNNSVYRTAPGHKAPTISPGTRPGNLTRGIQARNTFHGPERRKPMPTIPTYGGGGGGVSQHPDSSMAGQRPSFFNRITSKFSRR